MSGRIDFGMPEHEYHARPELSSTQARRLLESPAKYRWLSDHPEPPRAVFDVGTAAHSKILGVGASAVAYPSEHLTPSGFVSTKAATVEWAAEQRAAGLTPITPDQMDAVDGMAEAVLANVKARALLEQPGNAEASVFATDPDTGVDMRARFDFLPDFTASNPRAVDLKTTRDASPEGFARIIADHRYDIQAEWYRLAYGLATGDFLTPLEFIAVEKEPPYLVGVYPLSDEYRELGGAKVRDALNMHAACTTAGVWPDFPNLNPDPLQPPPWLMFREGAIA